MIIDPINNASSFLQTIKDIDTGINDHDITVLPEGEIGVLTPQKIMALDKMNTYAMLKKRPSSERELWSQPRSGGLHYRIGVLEKRPVRA
jgi:hypothetical protein